MRRIASYSVAWGSPDANATIDHQPFRTNAEAKAARDEAWQKMKKAGRSVTRRVLRGQLRPYWGLGLPCGITCDVYEVYEQ